MEFKKQLGIKVRDQFINRFGINEYVFKTKKNTKWDLAFRCKGQNVLAIFKERWINSNRYKDTMLELDKVNSLLELGHTSIYIAFFYDCFYVFNLNRVNYRTIKKKCPSSTMYGDRKMVYKDVIMIDINQGTRFEYIK